MYFLTKRGNLTFRILDMHLNKNYENGLFSSFSSQIGHPGYSSIPI